MKKLFSTLILALFACVAAQAQVIKWGYCDDNVTSAASLCVGGAIEVPEDVAKAFEGRTVTGIEVRVFNSAKNFQAHLWEELSLDAVPVTSSQVSSESLKSGEWHEIKFTTPYTISDKGFFVGYTTDSKYAIGKCSNSAPHYTRKSSTNWTEQTSGSLAVRVLIDGEPLPLDASLLEVVDITCGANKNYTVEGRIKNTGNTPIENFDFTYGVDDNPLRIHHFDISVAPGATENFSFNVNGEKLSKGNHTLHAELAKVNDTELPYVSGNKKEVPMEVLSYFFTKYMVVEKTTGDWCGYCPAGLVAFEMMEKYPRFIGIAVHGNDSFTISEYLSYMNSLGCNTYPRAILMRKGDTFKPAGTVLEERYKAEYEKGSAPAGVKLVGKWQDADEKRLKLVATSSFGSNNTTANYALTFVVLENNLKWRQNNYADSGAWEDKGSGYVECIYNHIPRATTTPRGIEGSVPTTLRAGMPYTYEYDLAVPSNIKDVKNMDLVVMLLDRNTQEVINAYKLPYDQILKSNETLPEGGDEVPVPLDPLADGTPEAIYNATAAPAAQGIFDMTGRRITNGNMPSGLYIVNGKKVVVK